MRRFLAMITVSALMMMVATVALGNEVTEPSGLHSYEDVFGSVSYSGSDGSLFWESPWKEIGEGDGPSIGAVYVDVDPYCADYKCLHILGQGESFSLIGVVRRADLSEFKEAQLAYEVKRLFGGNLEGNAKLLVQVSADGSTWDTIDSYVLETTDSNPIRSSKPIKTWISEAFAVRFVVTGILGSEVFIDNVQITGSVPSKPTTTTTTTVPTTVTTTKTTTTVTTIKTTTTTTKPLPTTTTTKPLPTTTTTDATTTTTSAPDTTTTTAPTTTTTTTGVVVVVPPATPPTGSGIRETAFGVQADYSSGLFGSMTRGQPEVLGVELDADYKMAVEVIESSWAWMVVLLVVIAGAIVSGLDRRKSPGIPPDA
jgi:hypothetical protein